MTNLLDLVLKASYYKDDVTACRQRVKLIIDKVNRVSEDPVEKFYSLDSYLKSGFKKGDCIEFTEVIKKGNGTCLGLSIIYKVIGDELGLPINLVMIKGLLEENHCYVLYNDGVTGIPVETQWDWKELCERNEKAREFSYDMLMNGFSKPESMNFEVIKDDSKLFETYLINLILFHLMNKDYKKLKHYINEFKLRV